ncbi:MULTISPECIES: ESX secretion-associated protein EspG [Actinoalloteichus]|uniref:EspG family n=1 Tax=Actinoalloteichus fjordicus TaxID=1612552 RepID=A0AAC9LHF9_9PSEU|nr:MULTISPECIES: ESX secretion-associated protein EspG [Actinoalloteichus]APU16379.1 EspG family [Actinoalloteichus fjordicus]APU22437.1 EspG family [Actinoalloteichus sp. GBA129-24]
MSDTEFVLSAREFEFVWTDLGLGRIPYPLDVPSSGKTMAERAELRAEVYRELTDRGLVTAGTVSTELEALLRLLSQPKLSVDAVGHVGRALRALAATDQELGVLATLVGDELRVSEIRPTSLARSIVGVLPVKEAGPGWAMSAPLHALTSAVEPAEEDDPWGSDDDDEERALRKAGMSADDAAALSELAANRKGGGQFGVTVGGATQRQARRSSTLVTWFDTHQGRYLMVREDEWLSLTPADGERIEGRVMEVLSRAAGAPNGR